jgi:hypothetical protein
MRKHLVPRERIDELVDQAIRNWPSEVLTQCRDDDDFAEVMQANVGSLRRRIRANDYGFLWTILLSALASAVIELLLKWWLERRANRVLLLVWRQEAMR